MLVARLVGTLTLIGALSLVSSCAIRVNRLDLDSSLGSGQRDPFGGTQLLFLQQPTMATAGAVPATSFKIQVADADGVTVPFGSSAVTLSLYASGADCAARTNVLSTNLLGGAAITGTNPVTASAGLAEFSAAAITRASPTASRLAGNVYVGASNGTLYGCSNAIAMTSGTMNDLIVDASGATDSSGSITLSVQAIDAYGNRVTSYVGTVGFAHPTGSTHASDALPANTAFVLGDAGIKSFSATLRKAAANHVIRVTDTVTAAYSGDTAAITVTAGTPTKLSVTASTAPPSTVNTGACSASFDICRVDAYDNISGQSSAETLDLATGLGDGSLYSDATCATAYNTPVIAASSGCKSVYFKDLTQESLTLSFNHATLTDTTSAIAVTGKVEERVDYTTASGRIQAGALADMNGDGKPDAVYAADNAAVGVRIRLGTGNAAGTTPYFGAETQAVARAPSYYRATRLKVGDLDGDGKKDVLTFDSNPGWEVKLSVFKGDGAGNVAAESQLYSTGYNMIAGNVASMDLIDINTDGILDVIVSTQSNNKVLLIKNDGTATLSSAGEIDLTVGGYATGVGDFNEDGRTDFVVSTSTNKIRVCLNTTTVGEAVTANWTFSCGSDVNAGTSTNSIAVGYIDGDAHLDIVVSNRYSYNVGVYFGTGAGTFSVATSYTTYSRPFSVALADTNGDGKNDIVVSMIDSGEDRITHYENNGSGVFTGNRSEYITRSHSGLTGVLAGKLNGAADTKDDVVMWAGSTSGNSAISVYLGK